MLHKKINLRKEPLPDGFMPTLMTYIPEVQEYNCKRPAVVVCPGGGYAYCSEREGERIALSYAAAGFNCFVVDYSVAPNKHPEPVRDLAAAMRLVRENAEEWNTDADKIAVIGFSAGGHLAASLSVWWNNSEVFTKEEIDSRIYMPNASILAYPVITAGEFAHRGSFDNLIGKNPDMHLNELASLETQVSDETPPTFLWHTFTDACVPVENSLLYAMALSKHKVPCEMHIYPEGTHGQSLFSDETVWCVENKLRKFSWMQLSLEWLKTVFGLNG